MCFPCSRTRWALGDRKKRSILRGAHRRIDLSQAQSPALLTDIASRRPTFREHFPKEQPVGPRTKVRTLGPVAQIASRDWP